MEPTLVLSIIGAVFAYASSQFLIVRFFTNQISNLRSSFFKETNSIKQDYMKKDDFNNHLDRLERGQNKLEQSIERIHTRFDSFLVEINKVLREHDKT